MKGQIKTFLDYQTLLKSMLHFFDDFCRIHHIRYTVCCGTMLGAVRHRDIIPWDGDIDVAMTRTEFDKLASCFKEYTGRFYLNYLPNYSIKKINKNGYDVTHARLLDSKTNSSLFCIDIYTIDFLGDDIKQAEKAVRLYKKYYRYAAATISYHKPPIHSYNTHIQNNRNRLVRFLHPLFWVISRSLKYLYCYTYNNFQQKYLSYQSSSKYCTLIPYYLNIGVAENFYTKIIDIEFGKSKVMILESYDDLLTKSYGDYMSLPPEDKRKPYPSEKELLDIIIEYDEELNKHINAVSYFNKYQ